MAAGRKTRRAELLLQRTFQLLLRIAGGLLGILGSRISRLLSRLDGLVNLVAQRLFLLAAENANVATAMIVTINRLFM